MLDERRIDMLLAVVEHGSFTRAAAALSFTASAVSQQMALLERDAGATLFERSPRGVRLTSAGAALVGHAEGVRRHLLDARAEVAAISEAAGGSFAFGSFPTATAAIAAPAIAQFHAAHPNVDLHFIDGEPYESVARLRGRELDLALVFGLDNWPAAMDYDGVLVARDEEIQMLPLFDDPFLVLLPKGHRLADSDEVKLAALAEERIIGSPVGCAPWGMDLEHVCQQAGVELMFQAVYRSADFQAQQALVASGLGITLLPRLASAALRDDVVVRPLMNAPARHVSLAWPAGAYRSSSVLAMTDIVAELTKDARFQFEADAA